MDSGNKEAILVWEEYIQKGNIENAKSVKENFSGDC